MMLGQAVCTKDYKHFRKGEVCGITVDTFGNYEIDGTKVSDKDYDRYFKPIKISGYDL
jgi:hypothetical protein